MGHGIKQPEFSESGAGRLQIRSLSTISQRNTRRPSLSDSISA